MSRRKSHTQKYINRYLNKIALNRLVFQLSLWGKWVLSIEKHTLSETLKELTETDLILGQILAIPDKDDDPFSRNHMSEAIFSKVYPTYENLLLLHSDYEDIITIPEILNLTKKFRSSLNVKEITTKIPKMYFKSKRKKKEERPKLLAAVGSRKVLRRKKINAIKILYISRLKKRIQLKIKNSYKNIKNRHKRRRLNKRSYFYRYLYYKKKKNQYNYNVYFWKKETLMIYNSL